MFKVSTFKPQETLFDNKLIFLTVIVLVAPTVGVSYLLFNNLSLGIILAVLWLPILWVLLIKLHDAGIIRVTLSLFLIAAVTIVSTFGFVNNTSKTTEAAPSNDCPKDSVKFSFENIKVLSAFAIFADFAELKTEFDPSITASQPLKFACRNWLEVSEELARNHNLILRIENGTMYVSKQ